MIPHDPALDAAYGANAWRPLLRATYLDPAGNAVPAIAPVAPAGRYVADSSRWPRAEATLTIPTAITPDRTASPVSPYGGSLLLDVGASFLGVERWFRLATLDVIETTIDRPAGTIDVRAVSHEARVDEDRIDSRATTSSGTGTALVISLVRGTLGSSHPVDNRVPPGSDPSYAAGAFVLAGPKWGVVEAIADASGFEAYFDYAGTLVLRLPPTKSTSPQVHYTTGDGGTLTGYTSGRGWAYNRVAQVYETSAGASGAGRLVGLWEDTNPSSATRVGGPYGRHTWMPDAIRVDTLPTAAVANRAAATIARRAGAAFRSVDLRTIPSPWIEPGDTASVEFLGGMIELLLVGRIEFPLDGLDVATVGCLDDQYTSDLGGA